MAITGTGIFDSGYYDNYTNIRYDNFTGQATTLTVTPPVYPMMWTFVTEGWTVGERGADVAPPPDVDRPRGIRLRD